MFQRHALIPPVLFLLATVSVSSQSAKSEVLHDPNDWSWQMKAHHPTRSNVSQDYATVRGHPRSLQL